MKSSRQIFPPTIVLLLFPLCISPSKLNAQPANHVVISEVYGGGGNSGSTYKNDYVELYNPTNSPITMTNWSIQYSSFSGTFTSSIKTVFSGTILSYGFFLVQEAQGTNDTTSLPTPDAIGTINLNASSGKVAIVNDTVTINGPSHPNVVDFVGYGSANQFEGSAAASALTNTTSAERKANSTSTASSMGTAGADEMKGNGWDSNQNNADFVIRSTQVPQNSSSPVEIPPGSGNTPPIISSLSRSPFVVEISGVDSVTMNVSDVDGSITTVRLHVRVNGGTFDSSITVAFISGTQYTGVIPTSKHTSAGDLLEYFISAIDDSGKYASTNSTMKGYFVGDAPISSIKAKTLANIIGYGARINGTINVRTNLFTNGQGYIQDATGGLQLFQSGGLPVLQAGRNSKIQGTVENSEGAYQLTTPSFSFIDTSLGTSSLTPVSITLPISQSASYVNEGKLVKISGVSTDSTGVFNSSQNYLYREADADTITARVESNSNLNTLVGRSIPSTSVDAIGILSFSNGYHRLKPRSAADMGFDPADGSGTATISPSIRFPNLVAVRETVTIVGDGTNTIAGVSVAIPASWTWTDTSSKSLSGSGFASSTASVAGNTITVTGANVTSANTGIMIISNLNTPSSTGTTTFTVKTRGSAGVLYAIALSPTVNVASQFEAVSTGNWSNPSTWSGGIVPGPSQDVTFTTLNVAVTIDISNAECNNLTMTGSGSASSSGPVLRFESTGSRQLTINGNLSITGGSGGGGGDRGGRSQLTSNGNSSAVLIIKRSVATTSSNSTSNGNAGLNMNEGTVRLIGSTTDSIRNGAGFRLGNLQVGDGITAKTLVWDATTNSTLSIRGLTIKSNSTFWIGSVLNANANDIGNASTSGVTTLTGGITIENGASLLVQSFTGGFYTANINLDGGGIVNNGTLDLRVGAANATKFSTTSPVLTGCSYTVNFGGLTAGSASTKQTISGSQVGQFANIIVDGGDTLTLQQDVNIPLHFKLTLDGTLIETTGNTVIGPVEATRAVLQSTTENFGGIGLALNAAGAAPGVTTVRRVTGVASLGGSSYSILRYFGVTAATNTGLDATLDYFYDAQELAGQNASTLQLWKSTDSGGSWSSQSSTSDTSLKRLRALGVQSLSRWTASDGAHSLGGVSYQYQVSAGWNMISVPLTVLDYRKTILYPLAVSAAYLYSNGYQTKDTLGNGIGYWLKFLSTQLITLSGTVRSLDTVEVEEGWNMIGTLSTPIAKTAIFQIPSGIVSSQYYGYEGSYSAADTLFPAKAYWVKASTAGSLVLSASGYEKAPQPSNEDIHTFNTLTLTDHDGNSQRLYFGPREGLKVPLSIFELPPKPPDNLFDARFGSQRLVEVYTEALTEQERYTIEYQSASFPITISWKIVTGTEKGFAITEVVEGKQGIAQPLNREGTFVVNDHNVTSFVLVVSNGRIPTEFALGANYPNPFNPTTRFIVAIPKEAYVEVMVYDILGRTVKTLLSDVKSPGYYTIEWNGVSENNEAAGSGVYFIRMVSEKFESIRKILMIK